MKVSKLLGGLGNTDGIAAIEFAFIAPIMIVLAFAMVQKTYGFPPDYWDNYPGQIMAVTAEDLQRVARTYLDPDMMQLVAVGDADKIKPALEKYGPIEVYDSTGKLAPISKTD